MHQERPRTGAELHVTLRAVGYDETGFLVDGTYLKYDGHYFVRADPAPAPGEDGLPTGSGAVVRARIHGYGDLVTLVRVDHDGLPWLAVAPNRTWHTGHDLSDVEVLFPGVPS